MKRTSKNNAITEAELFTALSRRSNSLPEDTVREVYFGLVKVIVDQFRAGREVLLPRLGKFSLTEHDYKRIDINTGAPCASRLRKVTFSGSLELRKYINNMDIKD